MVDRLVESSLGGQGQTQVGVGLGGPFWFEAKRLLQMKNRLVQPPLLAQRSAEVAAGVRGRFGIEPDGFPEMADGFLAFANLSQRHAKVVVDHCDLGVSDEGLLEMT